MMHRYSELEVKLLEHLTKEPMSIYELKDKVNISVSSIRNIIIGLEKAHVISKVDNRVPYIYRLDNKNPIVDHQQKVQDYKALLTTNVETDKTVVLMFRKLPKSEWIRFAEELEAIIAAVGNLDTEGRLIETL